MSIYKEHKTAAIIGVVFGLLAPFIGIFLGLQVSTMLGNILAFPLIIMSTMTGASLGNTSPVYIIIAILISVIIWSIVFVTMADLQKKMSK